MKVDYKDTEINIRSTFNKSCKNQKECSVCGTSLENAWFKDQDAETKLCYSCWNSCFLKNSSSYVPAIKNTFLKKETDNKLYRIELDLKVAPSFTDNNLERKAKQICSHFLKNQNKPMLYLTNGANIFKNTFLFKTHFMGFNYLKDFMKKFYSELTIYEKNDDVTASFGLACKVIVNTEELNIQQMLNVVYLFTKFDDEIRDAFEITGKEAIELYEETREDDIKEYMLIGDIEGLTEYLCDCYVPAVDTYKRNELTFNCFNSTLYYDRFMAYIELVRAMLELADVRGDMALKIQWGDILEKVEKADYTENLKGYLEL